MCVCVCVFVCAGFFVCLCICNRYIYLYIHLYIYIHTYTYTYRCMHPGLYIHIRCTHVSTGSTQSRQDVLDEQIRLQYLFCRANRGPLSSTRGFLAVRHLLPRGAGTRLPDTCTIQTASSVRSASQLPPVAFMCNECLCISASLPSHCNQTYTMRSNIFLLDRILSQSGKLKRCPFMKF